MALNFEASWIGPMTSQVLPRSEDFSKCTRQPLCSVLLGQRMLPSLSWIGLFLTGPIKFGLPSPSMGSLPSFRGFDQVWPLSVEVINIPHHWLGLGPTL